MSYSDPGVSAENELHEEIDLGCIDKDEVNEHKGMDEEIESVLKSKKHVGGSVGGCWQSFTNKLEPWKLKAVICMQCVNKVNYHKKIEQVKAHLQKTCLSFRKKMMAIEVMEHLSWYQSVKRSELTTPTAKGVNKTNVWPKSSKLSAASSHFEKSSIR